jgi:geranylgeranyl reductase family protein
MGEMKLYDVAVIGGGPVGSHVAYKLAEVGHGVVVLEQKKRVGERVCCAGIVGKECINSFAVDDRVILRWVSSAKLFSPSGKSIRLYREEAQACIVDRPAFDVAMADRAREKGAEYILNSSVRNIKIEDDRIRVEVAQQARKSSLEARAVVVATGSGSRLVEGLGLAKIGRFAIGAQAEVETVGIDEMELYFGQNIAPGFFAWLVPTSSHRALVGLLTHRRPGLYLERLMSSLLNHGKIVSAEAEPNYGRVLLKPLARTYGERLLVVGGAAGQVKPTTGGGIYYGLLCAELAADNLHRALETDSLSAKSLANYEREWKRRIGRELKMGYWTRRLYEHLSDRQVDKIFDIMKSSGIDEELLRADNLSFDWHGEAMVRLLGRGAIAKVVKVMRLPYSLFR